MLMQIKASTSGRHLLLLHAGKVWGCGANEFGQLADGEVRHPALAPLEVPQEVGPVAFVLATLDGSVLVTGAGAVWATGANHSGQLGLAGPDWAHREHDRRGFFPAEGLPVAVSQVAAGADHLLALGVDGSLWASGANDHGQLSLDGTENRFGFEQVSFDGPVKAVAASGNHSVVAAADGSLWVSGDTGVYGSLLRDVPRLFTQVSPPGPRVVSLSAGESHVLAVRSDGSMWAFGSNVYGQLGVQGVTVARQFTKVPSLSLFESVSCGSRQSMAVTTAGHVAVCGDNTYSSLGLGPDSLNHQRYDSLFAVVPGTDTVQSVSLTLSGSVLVSDSGIWVAGCNADGQLAAARRATLEWFTPLVSSLPEDLLASLAVDNQVDPALVCGLAQSWTGSLADLVDSVSAIASSPA
jgi:alpha-tubulin suppressor-like RCC1 family protein